MSLLVGSDRASDALDDLLHPLMAQSDDLGNRTSRQASGCRFSYGLVARVFGRDVSERCASESFLVVHRCQSRKLDKQTQVCLEY